ncbi:MAG: hypothetical protein R3F07_20655 [Opitutaceae bacterium]
MKILSQPVAVLALTALFLCQESVARALLVEGEPYQVRGVCYQPTPIGENPSQAFPYGDYFTANYAAVYERDLANLRAMGANTIRVYSWSPDADHSDFLDKCWNDGVDPIRVLVNRWINPGTDWSNSSAVSAITVDYLAIDSRLADHPAVLGLVLGNEANNNNGNGAKATFWQAMNTIAGAVKAQTPSRKVSLAITDAIDQVSARDAGLTWIDFWCIQVYRGTTFGTFFDQYAAVSEKPLIITEFGIDAYDAKAGAPYPDNGAFVGEAVAKLWRELEDRSTIAAGGCVFEYGDEWWKGGNPFSHDTGGFNLGGLPDGVANEEWWGIFAISQTAGGGPNTLTPRATYAALQSLWLPPPVDPPVITQAPIGAGLIAGGSLILEVTATGEGPLFYQWQRDGVDLPGATGSSLAIPSAQTFLAGGYTVVVSNAGGSTTSGIATVSVQPAESSLARLTNLSTRALSLTGNKVLIPGFVIGGSGTKQLLIRAVGASLRNDPFFVEGSLSNPRMVLRRAGSAGAEILATNDDWETNANAASLAATSATLGAFALSDSLDAALLVELEAGGYTVVADGVDGATGVAIVELYDADAGSPTAVLSNISNRGFVGQGASIMIPGVVVSSEGSKTLLIRAVGPALGELFAIQGALSDPVMSVFKGGDLILTQDNWGESPEQALTAQVAQQVGAFALPEGSADAAFVVTLPPGAYTIKASGVAGGTGVALVEVYVVD